MAIFDIIPFHRCPASPTCPPDIRSAWIKEHTAMPTPTATKVLIAFYSRDGATEALAKAGAEVRLRRARELVGQDVMARVPGWADAAARMNSAYPAPTEEDAIWADAIIFGTPTRFGAPTSELRAYIETLGGAWFQGKFNGKAGGAFGATSSRHGGNESTLLSLYNTFAHLGLIIVPTGYADGAMFKAGTPYGATAVVPPNATPNEDDLAAARFQGRRVTEVAAALRAAKSPA
jgi:NAD(P)H dehydrogenase (quinone)